ncbi:bifunctional 3-(3-hydroxy-phenyl)propionate/3-hydroxycinnamic acid hydroxylase [Sphingobium sp. JS3065]|uniref:bifunctional 3-(3-hydroxy-phenyl)propionate/3-hydroxycinnamic acid hydroxylase n=1 Tax=Sphingobium sp. JS3065 TaxID=2970925 RepID=UPI002263AEB7|nr:bifunctional 3-(3-hydroxy-phenyl)propionate/3-hydroxycinnamic acid hydroxylase [Sphingobium sp. JS3065]UZW57227.1 bifunctional 3-(3-hydroxy-phenyl)propionate/3-hydroxycinnamic acid hydroxylase [Sphingobium sp. JS3065]
MTEEVDVVIIGAGPVGLTIANYLGCMGVSAVVLEQRDKLIDYPRGVGMDDECLRSFQAIGLGEAVAQHTTPGQKMRFLTMTGKTFALIDPQTREFGWPRRNSFIQPMVDEILYEGLQRFDCISTWFGTELLSFEQTGDAVQLQVQQGDTRLSIRSRWLVGCDGGRSIVRKSLDIGFDGITDSTRWVVIDILDDPLGLPDSYLHCVPSRPYVSIALPHGMRRLEFMVFGDETEEELCSPAGIQSLLKRALPFPERANVLRSRVYTHNARLAQHFRKGNALIAGDAAHLMPVWQGQGYNSGIRDATNLAWKLAMVIRGEASADILESYESERREHAKAMIDLSVTAGRIFAPTNKFVAWLRDRIALALNAIPPVKRYFVQMRFKPMPRFTKGIVLTNASGQPEGRTTGRLFPQPMVIAQDGKSIRFDDVIGIRFAIVSWGTDPQLHLSEAGRDYWRTLGARFIAVVPETQLNNFRGTVQDGTIMIGDAQGVLHEWFAHQDADGSIVVLRPDRVVAAIVQPQHLEAASGRLMSMIGDRTSQTQCAPDGPKPTPAQRDKGERGAPMSVTFRERY